MYENNHDRSLLSLNIKFSLPVLVVVGALLFIFTYLGIQKSRDDSLQLLRKQGAALIESLSLSSDNAIKANSFFDLLVQEKFSDLAGFLSARENLEFSDEELADFASGYGVDAIIIFDRELDVWSAGVRGVIIDPSEIIDRVYPSVESFHADSAEFRNLETVYGELPADVRMYYFEKTLNREYIIVIVADALFYSEAKKTIGIGYLVQNLGGQEGIEYLFFQTPDGIIFSSRNIGEVLKIEKDLFLTEALNSDSIFSRESAFNNRTILELSRSFESEEYGRGVFRLGISLEKYYEIVGGYDRQMIALSLVIFAVFVLFVLYIQGKQKRIFLDRSFKQIQSLSEKVFDSIDSGLVVINKDGIVELANREFLKMFEITESSLLGTLWNSHGFKNVVPFMESMRKGGGESEIVYTGSSEKKHLLVNISRLYDNKSVVSGVVAVIFDYTRIKELEENARRKERLSELGDLAAGVAHEIRNPLNAISIAAQRLLAEFTPTDNIDDFRSFTGQIKSEAGRLNDIVTRFLAMTRDKSAARKIFNASNIVEETIKLMQLETDRDDINIIADVKENVSLEGDSDRFKQLLINLIRNGIDACENKKGIITVSIYNQDDRSVLRVTDNGCGIPDDIKTRVFNPYFSTRELGTGLGLSIVHRVMEEMNGEVEIISPAEGGTEFLIKFPMKA